MKQLTGRKIIAAYFIILTVIVVMLTTSTNAGEWSLGAGGNTRVPGVNRADDVTNVYSLRYDDSEYFITALYRGDYPVYGQTVDKHLTIAAGRRLYQYKWFYFDFGLAAHSSLSIANSSRIAFYENFGIELDRFRVSVSHTSNAGLVPPNEGETALLIEYRIEW